MNVRLPSYFVTFMSVAFLLFNFYYITWCNDVIFCRGSILQVLKCLLSIIISESKQLCSTVVWFWRIDYVALLVWWQVSVLLLLLYAISFISLCIKSNILQSTIDLKLTLCLNFLCYIKIYRYIKLSGGSRNQKH